MKKTLLLLSVLTASSLSFAAEKTPSDQESMSLQQRAEQEAKITDQKAINQAAQIPEAQISSGALVLEDPYEPITMRTFVWSFGFQLQDYQPLGRATLAENTSYNLSQAGNTYLPSVSLGSLYNLGNSRAGHFQMGLNGQLGYTSQNLKAYTSNNTLLDTRLSTTQMEAKLQLRWALQAESKLHVLAQAGLGQLNVSQSSDNSVARWSESAVYQISGLGLEYNVGPEWLAHLTYNQKSIQDKSSNLDIQGNNTEVGAKLLW
jgi:opacity protein-like surface antigen